MRFPLWLLLCFSLATPSNAADPARIAIIDTAWNTTAYLPALKASGVQVIGRYYARCEQVGLAEKRFAFTGEAGAILAHDMGILSIYQYRSSSKHKFDGQRKGQGETLINLPDASCNPAKTGRSAAAEARLDVTAAIAQARHVKQPRGTAIYFAVDFNFERRDTVTKAKVLTYFKTVQVALTKAGYKLGAYGNGDALRLLKAAGLVEYTWIAASAGFEGSSAFHRTAKWNLFQAQVDSHWFAGGAGECGRHGLPLDVNVQNPKAGSDIGLWGRAGKFQIPAPRTQAIHAARRFVCNGDARLRRSANSGSADLADGNLCRAGRLLAKPKAVKFLRPIRVAQIKGKLAQVDINEDGHFDGWTSAANLTRSFTDKPNYLFSAAKRAKAQCR